MADDFEFRPFDRCVFRGCMLLKETQSRFCPRHTVLVDAFGLEKAHGIEFGYACDFCPDVSSEEPLPCYSCLQEACASCRQQSRCCDDEEKANEVSIGAVDRLQRKRAAAREAAHG